MPTRKPPFRRPFGVGARHAPGTSRSPVSGPHGGAGAGSSGGGSTGAGSGGASAVVPVSAGATTAVNGSQAPVFLDDTLRSDARNGLPALATLMKREITIANQVAFSGKPYFSWISGGVSTFVGFDDGVPMLRQIYCGKNGGNVAEATVVHWSPATGQTPQATQGWTAQYYDAAQTSLFGADTSAALQAYPLTVTEDRILGTKGFAAANSELTITSNSTSAPRLHSGVAYQQPQDLIDPATVDTYTDSTGLVSAVNPYCGTQLVRQGGDVVGVTASSGSSEALQRLRAGLVDGFAYRRGQIGWSALRPGAASSGQSINLNLSSQNWRYIFDQAWGVSGAGMAGSDGTIGPAITLPLYLTAPSLYTQVRVYVFVYAAMSGTTNTGSIAIGNRNASGAFQVPTAVTNGPTISGTTFQWYPAAAGASSASLNLATAPYFLAYAGLLFDRVQLCAKSSGATDTVKIAAWTMIPIGLPH